MRRPTCNHGTSGLISRVVARSLDRVIDRSEYPLAEARNSNLRHRPVGIGVQGLADAFALFSSSLFSSLFARTFIAFQN